MSRSDSPVDECTLEYVKSLAKDKLYDYALKYLKLTASKRELNRAYRQLDHVKDQRRKYYYVRNDIYHPVYNEEGVIEKRHKRQTDSNSSTEPEIDSNSSESEP